MCRGRKGRMMTKTVVAVQPSQNHEDEAAPWRLLTFPVVAMLMS
ncbi:transposase for IS2606 domain protein [Mycobacterium ulcerans str. Harvey]|uniref:Transposase for IS2606 domain protein n=1 Tax=Mycobacterium ulcerans str. Harvey TaxID=1299332 RepID=A0ABN0RB18_MYCUL|nr:transposase for IS2606 domain protein [Mycobacterium ulcerans str. Harvey]